MPALTTTASPTPWVVELIATSVTDPAATCSPLYSRKGGWRCLRWGGGPDGGVVVVVVSDGPWCSVVGVVPAVDAGPGLDATIETPIASSAIARTDAIQRA